MAPMDETWRVSTRTGNNGACVEVRRVDHRVEVRDSKDRNGPVIAFPPAAWTGFVTALGASPTVGA
ncbi:DUF397 domain-containing protein [Plantactinospora sp. B5E13]|uniref:DUF397 domain-containing protein n=1 Tax=unclassified Plantactinospora TaxID=2631981 RepID=UPI00325E6847